MPPALLIGHSLGGAAVLAAAPQIASARAVVTIGAPHDPAHVAHNFGGALAEIHDKGAAEVSLAGRPFTIKKDFLDDIAGASLDAAIAGMKKALLVMHAPGDDTVGIENASAIFMAAKHPKSFVTLDKADHLVTRREDADYAADVIAAWADRYLPAAPDADIPEGVVRVSETGNRYQQDVSARGHHLTADEPSSVGGLDTGMTPYELVSAGLGACTAMTLRMYAQRKGLKLDHVEVDIAHNKVHAADCETCETTEGKIDRFARTIRIEGDLTEAERARLLEIADRCPVHRTLEREVQVTTEAG